MSSIKVGEYEPFEKPRKKRKKGDPQFSPGNVQNYGRFAPTQSRFQSDQKS